MQRRWVTLVIVVGLLLAASQMVLPSWAEKNIEKAVRSHMEDAAHVRVQVSAFPAVMLALGRTGLLTLDVGGIVVDGLMIDAFRFESRGLQLDWSQLMSGAIEIKQAQQLTATVVLTEEAMNEYLRRYVPEAGSLTLSVGADEAVLHGPITLLGQRLDVRLQGHFRVRGPAHVAFVPTDITVDGARVPDLFLNMIPQEFAFPVDLSQSGLPLVIDDLTLETGQLILYGTAAP